MFKLLFLTLLLIISYILHLYANRLLGRTSYLLYRREGGINLLN